MGRIRILCFFRGTERLGDGDVWKKGDLGCWRICSHPNGLLVFYFMYFTLFSYGCCEVLRYFHCFRKHVLFMCMSIFTSNFSKRRYRRTLMWKLHKEMSHDHNDQSMEVVSIYLLRILVISCAIQQSLHTFVGGSRFFWFIIAGTWCNLESQKENHPPTATFCESLIFMQEFCGRRPCPRSR
jgi:hypothetical protein